MYSNVFHVCISFYNRHIYYSFGFFSIYSKTMKKQKGCEKYNQGHIQSKPFFYIVAIAVNRNNTVGVAAVDLCMPNQIGLSYFNDSMNFVDTLSLLLLYKVGELLKNKYKIQTKWLIKIL